MSAASTSRLTISPPSPPTGASPSSTPSPAHFLSLSSPPTSPSLSPPLVGPSSGGGRRRSGSRTFTEAEEDARLARRAAEEEHGIHEGAITPGELRAEVETLLSLRRRSLSTPTVDPDLPPPTSSAPPPPPQRPQLSITINTSPTLSPQQANNPQDGPTSPTAVSPTAPAAAETGTLVRRRSTVHHPKPSDHPLPQQLQEHQQHVPSSAFSPITPDTAIAPTGQDLFWLPASLHPELAPQEFKAFIRDQTRPESLARRSSLSGSGSGLGRRKSTLRGEYKPVQGDGVGEGAQDESAEGGLRRAGSQSARGHTRLNFEELTIDDLQKLEMLAAKAETEGDEGEHEGEGERLGRVLRRSLSLNPTVVAHAAAGARGSRSRSPSPSSLAHATETASQEAGLSSETPLIVPPPGQILRRSARTQIRKNGRDGGSTRFGPSARRHRQDTADSVASTASDEADVGTAGTWAVERDSSYSARTSSSDDHDHDRDSESTHGPPPVDPYAHFDQALEEVQATPAPMAVAQQEQVDLPFAGRRLDNRVAQVYIPAPPPGAAQPEALLPNLAPLSPIALEHLRPASPPRVHVSPAALEEEEEQLPPPPPPKEPSPVIDAREWQPRQPQVPQYSPEDEQPSQRYSSPPAVSTPPAPTPPSIVVSVSPAQAVAPPQRKDSITSPRSVSTPTPSAASSVTPSPSPSPSPTSTPSPALPSAGPPLGRPASTTSTGSSRAGSISGEKKKSGWARLGLGASKDRESKADKAEKEREKKDKHLAKVAEKALAAEREKEQRLAREKAAQEQAAANEARKLAQAHEKERERDRTRGEEYTPPQEKHAQREHDRKESGGGGFLSGLFGKKKAEHDREKHTRPEDDRQLHHPAQQQHFAPQPPPPTASGALLPDGTYTNFYRLPIHVERAVYRLSHIKLANPRRPLYEQVLISNLMFWYLGVINSANAQPIPTAPPVPIPGMRKKEQEEREARERAQAAKEEPEPTLAAVGGVNGVPGGHDTRRPQVTRSAELPRDHQPLSEDELAGQNRLSAPADLYAGSTVFSSSEEEDNAQVDDDDERPLGAQQPQRPPMHVPRDSYPPPKGDAETPVVVHTSPKPAKSAGFEVTSRRPSQGTAYGASPYAPVAQQQQQQHLTVESAGSPGKTHKRLSSAASLSSMASDRSSVSFDEAGFLDQYSAPLAPSPPEGTSGMTGFATSDASEVLSLGDERDAGELVRVEEGEAILGSASERRLGGRQPIASGATYLS